MSDIDDLDDGGNSDGGKLRKQLETALKEKKELADKVSSFESKERARLIESTLSEKGLNPKLARFVPAEEGSDPARLETWIKENGELFAPVKASDDDDTDTGDGGQANVDSDAAQAFSKISKVSGNGSHSVTDLSALQAQMKNVKTEAEFNALVSQYRIT